MAKQTFTAGQVLTATQMNNLQANDYNWTTSAQTSSYVLVAANAGQTVTMTNAGATTITVNTGLFAAGDRVNILNLGAGTCTVTAGTATVNTAGSLALPQYGSGTLWFSSTSSAIFIPDDRTVSQGLTVITSETSVSATQTINVDNVFTSTYTNYLITLRGTAAGGTDVYFALRTGGSTAATNYNVQVLQADATSVSASRITSQTRANFATFGTIMSFGQLTLSGPQLAAATAYTSLGEYGLAAGMQSRFIVGQHTTATSYDGIQITFDQNFTGTYTIYGLAKS